MRSTGSPTTWRSGLVWGCRLWGFFAALLITPRADAADFDYQEYLVNDDILGEEHRFDPTGAPLSTGGYVLVWSDNGAGQSDVLSRVWGPGGTPSGTSPTQLNTDLGFVRQTRPETSEPGGGAILAIWLDGRKGSAEIRGYDFAEVYGRLLSSSTGEPLGLDFPISDPTDADLCTHARVSRRADGRTLVTWTGVPQVVNRCLYRLLAADGAPEGPIRSVTTVATTREQDWCVARPLPGGGWLLAWQEQFTDSRRVLFRFLDDDGQPLGESREVLTQNEAPWDQTEPALLVRADDFLVAWCDGREGGGDAFGRWFTHDGVPQSGVLALREAPDATRDERLHLVAGTEGAFAPPRFGGTDDRQRAFVRFFAADQSSLTSSAPMSDPPSGVLQGDGRLIPLQSGGWQAVWSDTRSGSKQVYHQARQANGSPVSNPAAAWSAPPSASQLLPDVALFPNGRAICVYGDMENGLLNVKARFLDRSGIPDGPSFQVNEVPVNHGFDTTEGISAIHPFAPYVAACSTGFVVTWGIDEEGGRYGLYAQFFDSTGATLGSNVRILPQQRWTIPQHDPRPVMMRDGTSVIAWSDNSVQGGPSVFIRRYLPNGLPTGLPADVSDAGAVAAAQESPALALSPFDELMVVWRDGRQGGADIFAQRYTPDGRAIGTNFSQNPTPDSPQLLQENPSVALGEDRIVTVYEEAAATTGWLKGRLTIFETLAQSPQAEEIPFVLNDDVQARGYKYPTVGMEASGRFMVVWGDQQEGIARVFGRTYDAHGVPAGDRFELAGVPWGSGMLPRLAVSGNTIQLVWMDTRRGKGWDVFARRVDWNFQGAPTPVALTSWRAESRADGIELRWVVPSDRVDTRFRLLRDEAGAGDLGPSRAAILLTPLPLEPVAGGAYLYLDEEAPLAVPVDYWLEEVSPSGESEYLGPFRAERRLAAARWTVGPNPARGTVLLRPPVGGRQRLLVRDLSGRTVSRIEGFASPGEPLHWSGVDRAGRALPAGVYWLQPEEGPALRIVLAR